MSDNSKNEVIKLKFELNKLIDENELLKKEKYDLQKDLDDLKHEYSENTIIQSMNDMKERYEELMSTTVPLYKYNHIKTKYNNIYKTMMGAIILNNHIKKTLEDIDNRLLYDRNATINKIKTELIVINEIMEDILEKNDRTSYS